jgi:hypothetical protein
MEYVLFLLIKKKKKKKKKIFAQTRARREPNFGRTATNWPFVMQRVPGPWLLANSLSNMLWDSLHWLLGPHSIRIEGNADQNNQNKRGSQRADKRIMGNTELAAAVTLGRGDRQMKNTASIFLFTAVKGPPALTSSEYQSRMRPGPPSREEARMPPIHYFTWCLNCWAQAQLHVYLNA